MVDCLGSLRALGEEKPCDRNWQETTTLRLKMVFQYYAVRFNPRALVLEVVFSLWGSPLVGCLFGEFGHFLLGYFAPR